MVSMEVVAFGVVLAMAAYFAIMLIREVGLTTELRDSLYREVSCHDQTKLRVAELEGLYETVEVPDRLVSGVKVGTIGDLMKEIIDLPYDFPLEPRLYVMVVGVGSPDGIEQVLSFVDEDEIEDRDDEDDEDE